MKPEDVQQSLNDAMFRYCQKFMSIAIIAALANAPPKSFKLSWLDPYSVDTARERLHKLAMNYAYSVFGRN